MGSGISPESRLLAMGHPFANFADNSSTPLPRWRAVRTAAAFWPAGCERNQVA
jgi:hypothetical protein